ncbi:hypothetical protein [Halobacterium yunchengense]|uniref:hypothetical protein n=1 Tax=Halobacterium yunchengense TaxID=3108497 RepID=UPI00300A434C
MDSISPAAVRTAGKQCGSPGVLTFFGKLMEAFWFGDGAHATRSRSAPTHRRSSHATRRLAP